MQRFGTWFLGALLATSLGCSPLSDKATIALFDAMKTKSGCGLIGGGAGSGAVIIPAPTVPMGGGYGYFWFAHADANHSVEITKDGGCNITVYKEIPIKPSPPAIATIP